MCRSGKSDPVTDDIGTVRLHRPDMSRVDFGATKPINQLEAANCTALVIRTQNVPTKNSITHSARSNKGCAVTDLLKLKRSLLFLHRKLRSVANTREQ